MYSAKTEVIGFLWASTLARYSVAYSRTGHLTSEKAYMEDKLKNFHSIDKNDSIEEPYSSLQLFIFISASMDKHTRAHTGNKSFV